TPLPAWCQEPGLGSRAAPQPWGVGSRVPRCSLPTGASPTGTPSPGAPPRSAPTTVASPTGVPSTAASGVSRVLLSRYGSVRPRLARGLPGRHAPPAQALHEREVSGNEEDTERGGDQHSPEHGRAHDVLGARARSAGQHQWHDAENEGEGGHQDGPEAQPG